MNTVFVIEELVCISSTARRVAAVCKSESSVRNWINSHNGDQLIMLDDGSIAAKYKITEYKVM
jgi:hypothetical protein